MHELFCSEKQPFSVILENRWSLISRFPFSWSTKKQPPEVLYATGACNFIKKRLWHRWCLPVNFAELFKTPFLKNTSGWLPLSISLPCWRRKSGVLALLCNNFSVLLILDCVLSKLVTFIESIVFLVFSEEI